MLCINILCYIDIMSSFDYKKQRVTPQQARKLVSEVMRLGGDIEVSKHAKQRMDSRNISITDIYNVLKSTSSRIYEEGELEKGSYRYRMETNYFTAVVAFSKSGKNLYLITAWDKR